MTGKEKIAGCIIGGAIGDAWGSGFENVLTLTDNNTFYLGHVKKAEPLWAFTDDTQLTIITLEALLSTEELTPETLANAFSNYYKRGKITGMGASTLKALQELQAGGHWSQVGRSGEYAAGNGAAMRIAPFAFWDHYTREKIRAFCRITHRNEEAYAGALAVVVSIQQALKQIWDGQASLIDIILDHLPDTRVRDRLIELNEIYPNGSIKEAARFGTSGYVVDSVPFSIFSASQVNRIGIESMYQEVIESGGDTDTNASIAGQIAGTFLGVTAMPVSLMNKLKEVSGFDWVTQTVNLAMEKLD